MRPKPKTEIPLKEYIADLSIKLGICETAVWHKLFKAHTLPMPKLRRVNARVVMVRV